MTSQMYEHALDTVEKMRKTGAIIKPNCAFGMDRTSLQQAPNAMGKCLSE